MEAEALALLLHHGAELVANEAEDVFDLGEVDVGGRARRVRCPQGDVRGGGVLHSTPRGQKKKPINRTELSAFIRVFEVLICF